MSGSGLLRLRTGIGVSGENQCGRVAGEIEVELPARRLGLFMVPDGADPSQTDAELVGSVLRLAGRLKPLVPEAPDSLCIGRAQDVENQGNVLRVPTIRSFQRSGSAGRGRSSSRWTCLKPRSCCAATHPGYGIWRAGASRLPIPQLPAESTFISTLSSSH